MGHVTDSLWNSALNRLKGSRILVMGSPDRMAVEIHVDPLIDSVARKCQRLEHLELRELSD